MCCGCSLESPHRGDSNEYPQHTEAILMSTHNICFYGELTKVILELPLNTLLICFSDHIPSWTLLQTDRHQNYLHQTKKWKAWLWWGGVYGGQGYVWKV